MHRVLQAFSVFVVATVTGVSGAFAAPQILALIETPEPTPLVCVGGVCQAEFSTMCLQKEREMPIPGTAYAPASPEAVVLVLTGADGAARRVPAPASLRFTVPRSYLSAVAEIPEADLKRLGATRGAAIVVAPLASLVPEPKPGDTRPLTAEEIATVTGPLRMAAHRAVKRATRVMDSVHIANRLANTLRRKWAMTTDDRRSLWRKIVAENSAQAPAADIAEARRIVGVCDAYDSEQGELGFLGCLQYRRDTLLETINETYWRRNDIGS